MIDIFCQSFLIIIVYKFVLTIYANRRGTDKSNSSSESEVGESGDESSEVEDENGKTREEYKEHTFMIKPMRNPSSKQGMYKISLGDLFKDFPTNQMTLSTLVSL